MFHQVGFQPSRYIFHTHSSIPKCQVHFTCGPSRTEAEHHQPRFGQVDVISEAKCQVDLTELLRVLDATYRTSITWIDKIPVDSVASMIEVPISRILPNRGRDDNPFLWFYRYRKFSNSIRKGHPFLVIKGPSHPCFISTL